MPMTLKGSRARVYVDDQKLDFTNHNINFEKDEIEDSDSSNQYLKSFRSGKSAVSMDLTGWLKVNEADGTLAAVNASLINSFLQDIEFPYAGYLADGLRVEGTIVPTGYSLGIPHDGLVEWTLNARINDFALANEVGAGTEPGAGV